MEIHAPSTGLLVVGHGTRNVRGRHDFRTTVGQIAQQLPETVVEGCFLELASPNIGTAIRDLAGRGCQTVVVAPLLLFAAGHAKIDIPQAAALAADGTGLRLLHAPVLGPEPSLVSLSARRFRAAAQRLAIELEDLVLIFVGRGNRDPAAQEQFLQYASLLKTETGVGQLRPAFVAMACPRLEAVIDEVAQHPHQGVVLQPHLLYPGELLDRVHRRVKQQETACPRQQQWVWADCLGCDLTVASIVVERFRSTMEASNVRAK